VEQGNFKIKASMKLKVAIALAYVALCAVPALSQYGDGAYDG